MIVVFKYSDKNAYDEGTRPSTKSTVSQVAHGMIYDQYLTPEEE